MNLLEAIIEQNDCSVIEAESIIQNMVEEVLFGADLEEVLFEEGLEPDYLIDLLDYVNDYNDFEEEYDY